MSQELSQAAVDVLCAAQDADVEPTTSLATISAAAIRAVLPYIQLSVEQLDSASAAHGLLHQNSYGHGLLDRQRNIVATLEALAAELEGPL